MNRFKQDIATTAADRLNEYSEKWQKMSSDRWDFYSADIGSRICPLCGALVGQNHRDSHIRWHETAGINWEQVARHYTP